MPKLGIPAHLLRRTFDEIRDLGWLAEGKYAEALRRGGVAVVRDAGGLRLPAVARALFAILRSLPQRSRITVVSPNTFFAAGAMAEEAGYMVVGADCSREDFCLSAEMLDRYAPGNTDVVILTHVGGGIAHDYVGIAALVPQARRYLVEDAAHALGVGSDVMMAPSPGGWGQRRHSACTPPRPFRSAKAASSSRQTPPR